MDHISKKSVALGLCILSIQLALMFIQASSRELRANSLDELRLDRHNSRVVGGDPVDLGTGLYVLNEDDIITSELPPILLTRTYRNRDQVSRAFGVGSTHPYDIYLIGDGKHFSYAELILADGGRIHFERISPGIGNIDALFEHTTTPTEFYHARMAWDRFGWTIKLTNGASYSFRGCNDESMCGLIRYTDPRGKTVEIKRDAHGQAMAIIAPNGHQITLDYDHNGRIKTAMYRSDPNMIQQCDYEYDTRGRLVKVRKHFVMLGRTIDTELSYSYDNLDQMRTINWPGLSMTNKYDAGGRVIRQVLSDGRIFKLDYVLDDHSRIIQTIIQDPDGSRRRVTFNAQGYTLTDTMNFGLPTERMISYQRESPGNRVVTVSIRCRTGKGPLPFQTEEKIRAGENPDVVVNRLEARCEK